MQFPMTKGPHAWKKRPRSPGLKWYKDYNSPDSLKCGRILVIDYVKQGRMLSDINLIEHKTYQERLILMVYRLF